MTNFAPSVLTSGRRMPNRWDGVAMLLVMGLLIGLVDVGRSTLFTPLAAGEATAIHLDPSYLPGYALRTTARMFAALFCSLVFTFTFATLAAKSRRAGLILIPILDILQSVPILGFLSFTVVFFLNLFPGRVVGAELACVFAIFTSQAWNMAFSFYQSLTTLPNDLQEAARAFRLSPWQKFWRLDVPFAMPGLVWNTMLSMSGGWFFVVASEAITVGNTTFTLPGIGSYVAMALGEKNLLAIFYAILAMLIVILLYDQLVFRPLVAWSGKFRFETTAAVSTPDPWMLKLVRQTRLFQAVFEKIGSAVGVLFRLRLSGGSNVQVDESRKPSRVIDAIWFAMIAALAIYAAWQVISFVSTTLHWSDLGTAVLMGVYTMIRVIVLMAIAAVVWVPIGVWIGLRPGATRVAQPIAQFLAAFPANLLFPPFVVAIVYFHVSPDIWLTPLMLIGTQWYILFNVIAGAAAFPGDMREAVANFRIRGWLRWRSVMIPGILPYFVTGAITASGGAWNASIVAEVASWGSTNLHAHGLGAYIAQATSAGDTPRIVLGVAVMSAFVITFNRVLWRPLYAYASRRTTLG
ncbi:MAG: sulfonate ABC transporter permease [Acidocella sp. 20-57-95]|nr:MAG: sulfonate ABC transporter permease [Acidocella sp. 20-57-95]OYV60665.1 MAG: sulfonate ABC transporter permease [Acidocella sp. 21-58-7]HQT63249.1 ABC transporter permease subunit [Acidocella sp.]HQU03967.1 ABC transporter permease subunit [Acidocella sp.]